VRDRRPRGDLGEHPGIVQREPTIGLPRSLEVSAFVVKNGERLWPARESLELVTWLAHHRYAVLGGEVYHRHDIGWGTYSREWSTTPPRSRSESWEVFVERARSVAIEYLEQDLAIEETPAPLYFLAFAGEQEPEVHRS
jgi:hypothetical protein